MTQRLKEAIEALHTIDDLPEEEQASLALAVLDLVKSARAKTSWGPKWRDSTPQERASEFLEWAGSRKGGPGLTLEQIHRDTIYE